MSETAIRSLTTTPDVFDAMLGCVDDDALSWKPTPKRWSISENIAHLIDVEQRNTFLRVKSIAEQDHPSLIDYDQNLEYENGTYSGRDGRDLLAEFRDVRAASVAYLSAMAPTAFERTGQHPEVGSIRASQIVSLWAFHDLSHIRQIAEIIKATTFWDGIGSMQHYYDVSP